MSTRSELGISPVLLQAIAHTLTSSALTASARDTAQTAVTKDNSDSVPHLSESQHFKGRSRLDSMSLSRTSASGVISHLLQNLNEPVASIMSQASVSSQSLQQLASEENSSVITQAGLSMLGISAHSSTAPSGRGSVTNTSSKNISQATMDISNEEITNFLLKDEPSDDLEASGLQQDSQSMNTVSSVLTALASQHMHESLIRKNSRHIQSGSVSHVQQQHQQQNLGCPVDVISNSSGGEVMNESRSQPQIIIYVNASGQEVALPASSPQGNDFVVSESEGSSDTPTTYRVLLQSQDDGGDSKHLTFPPNVSYTFSPSSNVGPVTDSQNTTDGMNRPCPVCGDKVSGK